MPIKFDKDGRFHIYHSEMGEQFLNNLTRINMVFIGGNTMLLILELTSPFFGYWHGVSLLATVLLNLLGSRMLHYYSTRMINSMWLLRDGKTVEVEFMNAFFLAKRERFTIRNFGYLAPSRVYNVSAFTYQQQAKLYLNSRRNVFKEAEYAALLSNIAQGREIYLGAPGQEGLGQKIKLRTKLNR